MIFAIKNIRPVCGDLSKKWCKPKNPNTNVNHHIPDFVYCGFPQNSFLDCETAGNSQTITKVTIALICRKRHGLYPEQKSPESIDDSKDIVIQGIDTNICCSSSGTSIDRSSCLCCVRHFQLQRHIIYATGIHTSARLAIFRSETE